MAATGIGATARTARLRRDRITGPPGVGRMVRTEALRPEL
jgi:hypothetical protein